MHQLDKCSVDECNKYATRRASGLCETHYYRMRRSGRTDKPDPSYRYVTGAGYIKLYKPDHPLADSTGSVFEHRYVMYQEHNETCPNCYWCGIQLDWNIAVIDHLDDVKCNNNPANLKVTCNNCNRARGAMKSFIAGLTGVGRVSMCQWIMK